MESLIETYGREFLAYVLGIDDVDTLADIVLTSAQEAVLVELSSVRNWSLEQSGSTNSFGKYATLAGINRYNPAFNGSYTNTLRASTGAKLFEITEEGTDSLLVDFLYLARDAWAQYLLPRPTEEPLSFWMSTPIVVFQHPKLLSIATSILNDPDLGMLFPITSGASRIVDSIDDLLEVTSLIYMNMGSGGSFQLISLVGNVLTDAVLRTLLQQGKLEWQAFEVQLAETLKDLRSLAAKKKVSAKTLVGIYGVQVKGSRSITIGNAILRAPRAIEKELFLKNAGALTAVLETSTDLQLLKVAKPDLVDGPDQVWNQLRPRLEKSQRLVQREFDLIRFALLLASPNETPWVASESARYVFSLMSPGGIRSWNPSPFGPMASNPVNATLDQEIQSWHGTLVAKHVGSLDVGMRRLLSATTARADPIDAFVDAVVAWENMFGAQSETTFRVTGAIAKLLSSEIDEREALHKELKGLYHKRSQLVHGGKEPDSTEIWKLRTRAIAIATDCFRTLYMDRPDLLELSSDARGARLLIE